MHSACQISTALSNSTRTVTEPMNTTKPVGKREAESNLGTRQHHQTACGLSCRSATPAHLSALPAAPGSPADVSRRLSLRCCLWRQQVGHPCRGWRSPDGRGQASKSSAGAHEQKTVLSVELEGETPSSRHRHHILQQSCTAAVKYTAEVIGGTCVSPSSKRTVYFFERGSNFVTRPGYHTPSSKSMRTWSSFANFRHESLVWHDRCLYVCRPRERKRAPACRRRALVLASGGQRHHRLPCRPGLLAVPCHPTLPASNLPGSWHPLQPRGDAQAF